MYFSILWGTTRKGKRGIIDGDCILSFRVAYSNNTKHKYECRQIHDNIQCTKKITLTKGNDGILRY